jgi:hypothetical protein
LYTCCGIYFNFSNLQRRIKLIWSNEDESCNSRSRLTANSHRLCFTFINFELVQILIRVFATGAVISSQLSSIFMQLFTPVLRKRELRKLSCKLSLLNSHPSL